ncbi:MAG: autotransporter-associated beta strand repeat-containing protein, partial [bacterium]
MPSFAPKRNSSRVRVNAIWLMNAAALSLTVAGVMKSSTFDVKGADYNWSVYTTAPTDGTNSLGFGATYIGSTSSLSAGRMYNVTVGSSPGGAAVDYVNTKSTINDTLWFGTSGTNSTTQNVNVLYNVTFGSYKIDSTKNAYTFLGTNRTQVQVGNTIASTSNSATNAVTFTTSIQNAVTGAANMVINNSSLVAWSLNGFQSHSSNLNPYYNDWTGIPVSPTSRGYQALVLTNSNAGNTAQAVELAGSGNITINGTIDNDTRTMSSNTGQNYGATGKKGNLVITSTGIVTLNGFNSYTGNTTISGDGIVRLGTTPGTAKYAFGGNRDSVSQTSQTGAVTGAAAYFGFSTAIGSFGTVSLTAGSIDMNGAATGPANYLKIAGLGKSSLGAIYNSSSNAATYRGDIEVTDDVSINTAGTGSLTFGGSFFTVNTGKIATFNNATVDTNISAALSGAGNLTKSGSGALNLSGNSNYTGVINFNAGKINLAGSGTTSLGAISFGATSNGVLSLSGRSASVGLLTSADDRAYIEDNNVSNATLTVSTTTDGDFKGALRDGAAGILSFTKSGSGTQTLSGANTYTGATAINAGTINLTGSLGNSATTIGLGATLRGTGASAGSVTVSDGAKITPGSAGVGALTVGATTLSGGGTLNINFYSDAGTAGTNGWSLLNTGALTNNATAGSPFTIKLIGITGQSSDTTGTPFTFDTSTTNSFKILSATSLAESFDKDKFAISSTFTTSATGTWSVTTQNGSDLYATYTVGSVVTDLYWSGISGWSTTSPGTGTG